MADETTRAPTRHLLIGGPGRAGTSFLVRYLAELGLETHLARFGETRWHADAQAGLEDVPLPLYRDYLPYVVKSATLHNFVDHILADGTLQIDGVIVPLRDLAEAAASRIVMELQHVHRAAPWMSELDATWETWAETPGGALYSLNALDQGRLLAVGFYTLAERLVRADIPLVLLSFPRIVADAEYLYQRVRRFLPATADWPAAQAAHARVADRAAVRIDAERQAAGAEAVMRHEGQPTLDAIALRREIRVLRERLAAAEAELARVCGNQNPPAAGAAWRRWLRRQRVR